MKLLQLDEQIIYDYSEEYKKRLIDDIKKEFSSACQRDSHLDNEYKNCVADTSNIHVKLKIKYGHDLNLSLGSVQVKYSYDITETYISDSRITGKVKFDSNGNADLSDLRKENEYSKSTETKRGTTTFFATKMEPCEINIAPLGWDGSLANCVEIDDVNTLRGELKKVANTPLSYEYISSRINVEMLPSEVREALKSEATRYAENRPRRFRMEISDYWVSDAVSKIIPIGYEFEILVEYNGTKYSQKQDNIDYIESRGETSKHYDNYQEAVTELENTYEPKLKFVKLLYCTAAILSGLTAIGITLLLIFASSLVLDALVQLHWWKLAICISVLVVFCILSFVFAFKWRCLYASEKTYKPSTSLKTLQKNAEKEIVGQLNTYKKLSLIWLICITVTIIVIGIFTISLCQKSKIDNFWNTPEIINTYSGTNEYSGKKILTVLSCDANGEVEAICEFINGEEYAKIKYIGKITKKSNSKTVVEFSLNEWLWKPENGNYQENIKIVFFDNYTKAKFDDTDLSTETKILSDTLYTEEILRPYMVSDNQKDAVLTITSCDGNGIVHATYDFIRNDQEGVWSKQNLIGEIIFKDTEGNMLVRFNESELIYASPNGEVPEIETVSFIDNFTQIHSGLDYYGIGYETTAYYGTGGHIISTPEDISKLNNSEGLFVLQNDIDFSGYDFTPIKDFRGTLYGNGFSFKNISISASKSNVGIFSKIGDGGAVIDLNVENAYVSVEGKYENVGILCGINDGYIFNVTVSGEVNAPDCKNVGGVAGQMLHCNISGRIQSKTTVYGKENVGGCFGYHIAVKKCMLFECKNSGNIYGKNNVGGIVGYSHHTISNSVYELINCENTGNISGTEAVGGYIGYAKIYTSVSLNLAECSSTGSVIGEKYCSTSIGKRYE